MYPHRNKFHFISFFDKKNAQKTQKIHRTPCRFTIFRFVFIQFLRFYFAQSSCVSVWEFFFLSCFGSLEFCRQFCCWGFFYSISTYLTFTLFFFHYFWTPWVRERRRLLVNFVFVHIIYRPIEFDVPFNFPFDNAMF